MSEHTHRITLDHLIRNLDKVDEHPHQLEWTMREGDLYCPNQLKQLKFCDILLGYYDGENASALELKRSPAHREKAILQLNNGEYLLDRFGYKNIMKKIVYYGDNMYHYECI